MPVTDGLIIHLKADSLSLNDNDFVTTWADSAAGDSVDGTVSQVSDYGVPVFKTNVYNGMPAVRFTRPADPAAAPNSQKQVLASGTWSWDQTKGVTVFIVCTGGMDGASGQVQRVVQVGKFDGEVYKSFGCDVNSNQSGATDTGSGVRYNNGWCCTATAGPNPVQRGVWHVSVRQIAQGGGYGGVHYSVNDITFLPTTTNQPGRNINFDAAGNDITIGNGHLYTGNWTPLDWYDGDVAEVLVYNKQLTPAQIKKVSGYLNEKYEIYTSAWGKNFTIAAIPDTQGYPNHVNQPASTNLFKNEMQFIADNINNMNIVFASHEGDVVMTSNDTQYARALSAMEKLKNTLPFGMAPGNHDYDLHDPERNATKWNANFGPATDFFRDKSWYGGAYISSLDTSGMTTYQTFSTADMNFLHIAFEVEPCDAVLNWAQGIINSHPGWPTIVTTHSFLSASDGEYRPANCRDPLARNSAQQVWDKFIKVNPQIFMLLCGHSFVENYNCSWRRDDLNNAGYPVHQLLADYQACYSGADLGKGGGWIRLMEFSPLTNTVRVRTYSTILNKYSSDPSLTDGSAYARQWAAFNYNNQGEGSLYAESHAKASEYTIPFIYGRQLSRPSESYGVHIAGLTKSFAINGTGDWAAGGIAFDPSFKLNGNYDRVYYVNKVATGAQGLYSASISQESSGSKLALGTLDNPYGCAVDADGDVYVCYNATPAVWKVTDPGGSPAETQMIGNYRNTGDDDIQSIMMVPYGFGGSFDAGVDLVMIDSGLDADANEAIVALESTSTAGSPLYTVIWEDVSGYFTADIKGCVSEFDGYCYMVPTTIPTAGLGGVVRPYINRIRADGVMQRIFLDADITRGGASSKNDDSITVNPVNGSVWLATAADTSQGSLYPRTVWRIDMRNAVWQTGNDYLASATAEITNAYINFGVNGMAWSPDGKYLAMVCPDSDKLYVYTATVPDDCADAIEKGYGLTYDFNDDCKVNLMDFAEINFSDLVFFVESWLYCIDPQSCDWLWP